MVECILVVGSYCYDFRVIRACLAGIPPLYYSFDLPYTCPTMGTSSEPNRFSCLRIGGKLAEESESGRVDGGSGSLAVVVNRAPPAGHPSPLGKGKGKISEIRYPSGSEYLRAAVKYADAVGLTRVEPLYGKTFVSHYRPPLGVQVWCPDLLTSYIVQVPKMVCFFQATFKNGFAFLCIPLLKVFYSTLTSVHPNFLPISRAFWLGYWSSLDIKVLGFPTYLCSWTSLA